MGDHSLLYFSTGEYHTLISNFLYNYFSLIAQDCTSYLLVHANSAKA